jgi:hypothetical protein
MAVGFIPPIIGRYNMFTMIDNIKKEEEWILTANDRCDSCDAQAYVKVSGVTGDLLFCSHHYNKIMDNAVGYDKMMKFMYQVLDERSRLTKSEKSRINAE